MWYLMRGDAKSDQTWGVALDDEGSIYTAGYEQKPNQWFTDMVVYKVSQQGEEIWRTEWGGQYQEKAFVITITGDTAYVGGLTHTGMGLTQTEMGVLALDTGDGHVLWSYTWGQGYGYQEVDGLLVDGDVIYVSGWTTSEGGNYDIAVLALDLQGNMLWKTIWGTEGFDSADGQLVLSRDSIYVSGKKNADNMVIGGQAYVARFSRQTGEYLQDFVYDGHLASDGLGLTGNDGAIYMVGMDFIANEGNQVFIAKLDDNLNMVWDHHWGPPGGEYVSRSAVVTAQNILVVGVTQRVPNSAPGDITLLFYDLDGNLMRTSTWGGEDEEIVHGIAAWRDYLYLACEIKYLDEKQNDAMLIKAHAISGDFPPLVR